MKDKVFILGAGRGQLNLIEICKRKKFETIVISSDGDFPGFDVADRYYKIDITDKNKVLEAAKKEKISAIITDQIDVGVQTAAFIAEKLGIPGIGYGCSLKFTNKYIMKQEARRLGINVAEFISANDVQDAYQKAEKIGFPVVMKPVDHDGSRGVFKINNRTELEINFATSLGYSMTGEVIIEQFISGAEYETLGFVHNYHFDNLIIGRSYDFDIPNLFIPKERIYIDVKSVTGDAEKKILDINKKLVEGFGLKFGISQAEFLYDKERDKVYLVEIAARGGGIYISSDLVPLTCGIDINELLVDFATNRRKNVDLSQFRTGAAAYLCFTLPAGKITKIENADKLKEIPGVHKVFLDTIYVGKTVEKIRDKSMRIGPILVHGKNEDECIQIIERVKETLNVWVQTEHNGIQGIQW
ncbi:hypothetical protein DHBDCA_p1076 [Dehalobacter sp. DCA]|uniref:ATP-grasp domain-containing protein n=1 Tax=Dehalobacter sp. DCA TaxID=1147129 RepID=UPI00028B9EAA|nr:ATP-grasp domain-containing protein [Dehalobacter sp. DCA]AFV02103.1 hypothetical protein DHBDCA_p1076 [Dehalobacter sp. DCA]